MKKSLLALVVMGAFAGAAQAQVTLYGLVDVGVVGADNGDDSRTGLDSGIAGASRWGIKGSEDLGGGLGAHFVLESGFDASSGDGDNVFSRLAYAGLTSGFGTVRLGRQDTVMKEAMGDLDPFGAAGIANAHDYFLGYAFLDGTGELDGVYIDQRRANTLTYQTPNFGGFNATAQYNFGNETYTGLDGDIFGARIGYENGPIAVQLAHETIEVGVDADQKDTILGGSYDFGIAKLHAAYGDRSVDAGTTIAELRSGMIGASAKFGNGKVMANFIRVEDRDLDADSDVFAIGYNHSLSKRTILSARYIHVSNDNGARLGATGGDYPVADIGETAKVLGLGVQHKF